MKRLVATLLIVAFTVPSIAFASPGWTKRLLSGIRDDKLILMYLDISTNRKTVEIFFAMAR